jgi:glycosyltransferase involved in cell wall biosynthesis
MMKVIHIILGKANPNRQNGVNKVVSSLAAAQNSIGLNVEIWGITKVLVHDYPKRPYITKLFQDEAKFSLDRRLKEAILEEDSNGVVFHFHGAFIPQFFMVSRLLIKENIKYVVNLHGGYNLRVLHTSKLKKTLYFILFDRYFLNHAKVIQLIGQSEIEGIRSKKISTKYVLIPNGQELKSFSGKKSSKLQFVFCGRIDIQTKGLDILVQAVKECVRQGVDINLKVIGGGNQSKAFQLLIRKNNLAKHIVCLGPLFGKEKDELIGESTALVLTSRNEGIPGVVLESMALGVPVIVSPETNLAEQVSKYHCGLSLENNSPKLLAEALKKFQELHGTNHYSKMAENCRRTIAHHFSWTLIAQEINKLYNN